MSTIRDLIKNVVEKRPHDTRKVFEDLMVEKMRDAVDGHREVVAESLFDSEEASEGDE